MADRPTIPRPHDHACAQTRSAHAVPDGAAAEASGHSHGHAHGGGHSHDHAAGAGRRRLAIAFAITSSILIAEVIGAVITGSLALLVDAAHMLVDAGGLHRRLSRAPKLLDGDRVAALSDLADLPSTWASGAGGRRDTARLHDGTAQVRDDTVQVRDDTVQVHDDTVRLHDRFGSIRAEVRSAAGVRFAWIAGAAGIAVGVVWGVVAVLVGGAVGA